MKATPIPCGTATVRGGICEQAPMDGFPCCRNHLGHWSVDSRSRLLRVFRAYDGRVARVWPRCGGVCGKPAVRDWPEIEVFLGDSRRSGVEVRLQLADATVIADALAGLGDHGSATAILEAVEVARAEWPARQLHLANCGVFGCGSPEISPRSGWCDKHPPSPEQVPTSAPEPSTDGV